MDFQFFEIQFFEKTMKKPLKNHAKTMKQHEQTMKNYEKQCKNYEFLCCHLLHTGAWVATTFSTLLLLRAPFVVAKSMVFNTWTTELAGQCMGF